jgi:hypothetical protein
MTTLIRSLVSGSADRSSSGQKEATGGLRARQPVHAGAVAYLSVAERLGQRTDVRLVVETHHHTIAPSASLAYRLVSRFDPGVIGAWP